ncbi:hypothetical protein GCM10023149_50600 [Mucilaginibacter gynuensis]|uniref:Uncharacterized protein n=1 Tax=Mucilaginibacter gynuensis TaxID=1302236 RepID=A0ABP8HIC1_9SPHI
MKKLLIGICLLFMGDDGFAQKKVLNIPGIHQLVDQSKSENKLQVKARDKQAVVTANERANLTLLEKLKDRYRELQQRYNTLGLLINAADIGISATPMVNRIISNQGQILAKVQRNPALLAIGFDSELVFAEKAYSLLTYIAGVSLSFGDINQMRASDRKILFDFVLLELSHLQDLSNNMLGLFQYADLAAMLKAANPFQHFIDADLSIAKEIIQNAKYLK